MAREMAEKTARKQRGVGKPFPKGTSGNPAGRPKGSRNKLGESFVAALCEDFEENGAAAIRKVRADDPSTYVRVVAGLLPKEFKDVTERELTDEQLDARIRQVASALGIEIGAGGAARGETAPGKPAGSRPIPPVH